MPPRPHPQQHSKHGRPPKPIYSFTIPSLHDDTPLNCRIYHPANIDWIVPPHAQTPHGAPLLSRSNDGSPVRMSFRAGDEYGVHGTGVQGTGSRLKGAIMAHPYAPLGGNYDDRVVMGAVEALLGQGFVVGTFNFRGAEGSKGSTSWSGRAEREDYVSFTGVFVHYLYFLDSQIGGRPHGDLREGRASALASDDAAPDPEIDIILGGYSYGSLILTQILPTEQILARFKSADEGTATSEIVLRAHKLASETKGNLTESNRGREALTVASAMRDREANASCSPMTFGGEETLDSARRSSKENNRKSLEFVRRSLDIVPKISSPLRKQSKRTNESVKGQDVGTGAEPGLDMKKHPSHQRLAAMPKIRTRYLLISPLLPPVSYALSPPGISLFGRSSDNSQLSTLMQEPALAVFGSNDMFTSSRKLRSWCAKMQGASAAQFEWQEIEGAGHFWIEKGVMSELADTIATWASRPGVSGAHQ